MPSAPRAPIAPHVVLLLVQVAFASLAVEGKIAMSPAVGVSPAALAMARILGAAVGFAILARRLPGEPVRRPRDVATMAGLALLGVVMNQALYLAGLARSSPFGAVTLGSTIPVFAAAAAVALGRDRLSARSVLGMALATLGVLVLGRFTLPTRGDLYVLANALSYGVYLAVAQPVLVRFGSIRSMAWMFALGAIWFAPIGGVALVRGAASWSSLAWSLVAFVVAVPTLFAYGGNAWALARVTPGQVASYVYLQPVLVAILQRLQLGQPIELRTVVAAALIMSGVTFVVQRRAPAASSPAPAPGAGGGWGERASTPP